MTRKRQPAVFFGHGSPGNVMEDNSFTRSWSRIGDEFGKPRAIICISAHWYTRGVHISSGPQPATIHDFGGFPQKMYDLQYPAPGDPELAREIRTRLDAVDATLDGQRGLDHGCWCVLSKVYPYADVPVVQISMNSCMLPSQHFELGSMLSEFRDQDIMIVGSGNIVHNLPEMDWNRRDAIYDWAARFGDHIRQSIVNDEPQNLIDYAGLGRDASLSVPSPDHYLPLLYVMGTRHQDEPVRLETPIVEYGSLDMTSVIVGP